MKSDFRGDRENFRGDRENFRGDRENFRGDREKKDMNDKNIKDAKDVKEIKEIIKGFVGKNINVALRGKKTIKGKLEKVSQYEILVSASYQPILVMKHAIDYIEIIETP